MTIRRIDLNWNWKHGSCPDCVKAGKRWTMLSVPWEGRTDIVRCRCGYVSPRFVFRDIPDRPKKRRGGLRVRRKRRPLEDY